MRELCDGCLDFFPFFVTFGSARKFGSGRGCAPGFGASLLSFLGGRPRPLDGLGSGFGSTLGGSCLAGGFGFATFGAGPALVGGAGRLLF